MADGNALTAELHKAAEHQRQHEKSLRRAAEAGGRLTPAAIVMLTMADLRAKAAAVFEDALHALEHPLIEDLNDDNEQHQPKELEGA